MYRKILKSTHAWDAWNYFGYEAEKNLCNVNERSRQRNCNWSTQLPKQIDIRVCTTIIDAISMPRVAIQMLTCNITLKNRYNKYNKYFDVLRALLCLRNLVRQFAHLFDHVWMCLRNHFSETFSIDSPTIFQALRVCCSFAKTFYRAPSITICTRTLYEYQFLSVFHVSVIDQTSIISSIINLLSKRKIPTDHRADLALTVTDL